MAINLISKIKPKNAGAFPVYEDVDGYGGFQTRDSISDRNSIPVLNRKIGMLVYVRADGIYYTLSGGIDNANWIDANLGIGGSKLPVLKGGNTANEMYFDLLSGSAAVNDTTFTVLGATRFDLTLLSGVGTGSRVVGLQALLETTGPTAYIQLYDFTYHTVVTGSEFNTSSLTPYLIVSGDLTAGLHPPGSPAIYQIQVKMASGGGPGDRVTCTMARLVAAWS
jgi:hypothetical protein